MKFGKRVLKSNKSVFRLARLAFWPVTSGEDAKHRVSTFASVFSGLAVRPISGAQALQTSGADVIAGLVCAMHEAKRVRDMRKYPFWARGAECVEILRFVAPGKILRDSPTRRDTPKKECCGMSQGWSFGQ